MRVAVIGSGISGMVVAARLHRDHEVTVFEAGSHVGGHTNTVDVDWQGRHYAVDTGFIVFNDWTYPRFIALLNELGVEYQSSNMSFSLRDERNGLEYNGTNVNTLFAQRLNALRPSFLRMIADILRFNKRQPRAARGRRRHAHARRIPRRGTVTRARSASSTSCPWACRSGRRPSARCCRSRRASSSSSSTSMAS